MVRFLTGIAVLWAAAAALEAVETKTWYQSDQADFQKGRLKGLSVRSDGRLTLASRFEEVLDSSTPYLWAVAVDSRGNLYAGGGGPGATTAKLFQVDPKGSVRTLAELNGLEIHAIAVNAKDQVFAATSPDGRVYRVSAAGKPEVFYSPGTKYIWAMAFNSRGELFLATGDQGEIHRVGPDGKGSVFFRTEEAHARSLAVDLKDNLIVGTEPGGLILRVSPAGDGFVVYQSAKREITALAVASDGSVYAAGVGNKQPQASPLPVVAAPAPVPSPSPAPGLAVQRAPAAPSPPPTFAGQAPAIAGGSEVFRIDPDGYPRKVWSDPQEITYAIGFDDQGRPLLGTGNKGNIYRLDSDLLSTLVVSAPPTQVTAFSYARGKTLYAATGNIGKVYRLGPGMEREGTLESEVFDSGSFTYWGSLWLHATSADGVSIQTRSGNLDRPQKNWSAWAPVVLNDGRGRVVSPPARFLQWQIKLAAAGNGNSPEVSAVEVAHQPKNAPPQVELIEVTPPNHRFPAQSLTLTPSQNLTLPPLSRTRRTPSAPISLESSSATMNHAKGFLGARWLASDPNGDGLLYKAEIRGEQETVWKPLKDKIRERFLSFDSTAFADGEYRIRVTASDSPDNPPDGSLTGQLDSEPFTIDNTAPRVESLSASRAGGRLEIRWKARDSRSIVENAEYSVNGGDWIPAPPTTRLADDLQLEYAVSAEAPPAGEVTVAVRVTDEFENQATEKIVLR